MHFRTGNCLQANTWTCPKFLSTRSHQLEHYLLQHVQITVEAVVVALLVSVPVAVAVRRSAHASGGVLGLSTAVYTVPSLALFGLLVPVTGLEPRTVVIGLVLYSLTILIRGVLTGLAGVPVDVVEAARGMGMGTLRILARVELPLAMPAIFASLRVATVSTVALTTIGYLIGEGGLGTMIAEGFNNYYKAEVFYASLLCVVLAVVLDGGLVLLQRLVLPWARRTGVRAAGRT